MRLSISDLILCYPMQNKLTRKRFWICNRLAGRTLALVLNSTNYLLTTLFRSTFSQERNCLSVATPARWPRVDWMSLSIWYESGDLWSWSGLKECCNKWSRHSQLLLMNIVIYSGGSSLCGASSISSSSSTLPVLSGESSLSKSLSLTHTSQLLGMEASSSGFVLHTAFIKIKQHSTTSGS